MIVMDCSAAVEIALQTDAGKALLSLIDPNEKVLAPTWFQSELRNAFWKYVHANIMDEQTASQRIRAAESLITDFIPLNDYKQEAFSEAVRYDHSFYDMVYLCLARRNAAVLFSCDKKLIDICNYAKVNCVEEIV